MNPISPTTSGNDNGSTRRRFLQQCGGVGLAASGVAASGLTACATDASAPSRMLMIDALGEFSNPNLAKSTRDRPDRGVDARALTDAKASGLSAVNLTIGYVAGPEDPFEMSVRDLGVWDAIIRRYGGALSKVLTANDIRDAHAQGKLGLILGFQNGIMMGKDASRVAIFANLGVRVIQLTYNVRNQLGDGSMVPENRGLTEFGRSVVDALNTNRVLVDLSHSGEQTCLEATAASRAPILISHTGCRALTDLPRNKTDRELRLVAERGGFVGIYFMPFLLIDRQPMAIDLIEHIEHAIKVCGEDHVGIGTDGTIPSIDDMARFMAEFKAEVEQRRATGIGAKGERADIVTFLPDLTGPDKFYKLIDLLAKRGHSKNRIEKIMGGNFLRVAAEVW